MLPIINLTSNRTFQIRNFEEDKSATLKANKGLFYLGKDKEHYKFKGNYYLTSPTGNLIESFEISILVGLKYPNSFPIVILFDNKIDRSEDYHINENGVICFEHNYIINFIIKKGFRLYDFMNYYMPKYFSWVLVKKYGDSQDLKEWSHGSAGTKQLYEILLGTNDKVKIHLFLDNFCKAKKVNRNHECYCGSDKKIKNCHIEAIKFLKATPVQNILNDMKLFE